MTTLKRDKGGSADKEKDTREKEKEKEARKAVAKQFRETRIRLEKYKSVLLKSLSNQENFIKVIKTQDGLLRTEFKADLDKFSQWANPPLLKW